MSEWTKQSINSLLDAQWPGEWGSEVRPNHSAVVVFRSTDIDDHGHLREEDGGVYRSVPTAKINSKRLLPGDILLEASGGAPDRPVGRVALFEGKRNDISICANFLRTLRPKRGVSSDLLRWVLFSLQQQSAIWRYQQQTTGIINLKVADYLNHQITTPPLCEQNRIAEILSTLDHTIEQTEALIAKYQQIKVGLMHDLFTRGVTLDGGLRPTRAQAPHLYKESPLGWIPTEWRIAAIEGIAESLVDGPFGSNLKSEHYVSELGVRVVRLQNIQEGRYNDRERAFVSQRHAEYLGRHKVNPGDVLIAALGEDNNVVGRACCYPEGLPPAINKADCFRFRCNAEWGINSYVMHFLNTAAARTQVRQFEQGVTRRRINLGNLRRIRVVLPNDSEQARVVWILAAVTHQIETAEALLQKLMLEKRGLMHDLLTGRVRVTIAEPVAA